MNDEKFIGINSRWGEDILLSIGLAVVFIALGMYSPAFLLGTPITSAYFSFVREMALFDQFLVVVIIAPILEEFFFRFALFGGIATVLESWKVGRNARLVITILLVSVLFSIFHYGFYGQTLYFAYIGAFLFSVVACLLVIIRKSQVVNTALHMCINMCVIWGIFVVV